MDRLPHRASPAYDDFDLLTEEPAPTVAPMPPSTSAESVIPAARETASMAADGDALSDDLPAAEQASSTVYLSLPGIPGRGVVVLFIVAAAACTALDLLLTGGLSVFFDQCFVVMSLAAAMSVRRIDVFVAGVLPPLVFALVISAVAIVAPASFGAVGGVAKLILVGLTVHATGLFAGYGVALLTVAARVASTRRR